jgi:hypothetical protein
VGSDPFKVGVGGASFHSNIVAGTGNEELCKKITPADIAVVGGKDAENSPQRRRFLLPFDRYRDNSSF